MWRRELTTAAEASPKSMPLGARRTWIADDTATREQIGTPSAEDLAAACRARSYAVTTEPLPVSAEMTRA
jgi:hypothetical protein